MTLQENYRDLEGHQIDFEQRKGFTYTVETPAGDRCLGCVYIYPCQRDDYDAQVYYWVRDSVKAQGLETELGTFCTSGCGMFGHFSSQSFRAERCRGRSGKPWSTPRSRDAKAIEI